MKPTIESIEKYIHDLYKLIGQGMGNITPTEFLDDDEYNQKLKDVDYSYYIISADYHYFVSRTLFMHYIFDYSLFPTYQCIENYLKAFIRSKNFVPELTHSLKKLLNKCKDVASPNDEFIRSEEISTIIYKYRPFYTSTRYPVSKEKFFGRSTLYPYDIYILDYFVYRFREMLPYPENKADILNGDTLEMMECEKNRPAFYQSFREGNINFIK